jgi:hypothetical protein
MSRFEDAKIAAYLTGVLDPSEAHELEQDAERDPGLRERVRALQTKAYEEALELEMEKKSIPPLSPEDVWWKKLPFLWPFASAAPQLTRRMVTAEATLEREFGAAPPPQRPFALNVTLRLEPAQSAVPRQIVLMSRSDDGLVEVLAPTSADELLPLDGQPKTEDGGHKLNLRIPAKHLGRHLAIVLPPMTLAIDWDLNEQLRWAPLMELIDADEVPHFVRELKEPD